MKLGIHFCDQSGKSYYCNSIQSFLCDKPNEILGSLTKYGAKYGFDSVKEQIGAWEQQISLLQQTLANAGCSGDIIFEYDIVRMGKRIDVYDAGQVFLQYANKSTLMNCIQVFMKNIERIKLYILVFGALAGKEKDYKMVAKKWEVLRTELFLHQITIN